MFRGFSALSLDAKGRLAIPARYRARLTAVCGNQFMLTAHPHDPCLLLYPLPEWEAAEARLLQLPDAPDLIRTLKRVMSGYATECEPDGQGRILLPQELREIAMLERDVMLFGQRTKFEIWSKQVWDRQRDERWLSKMGRSDTELPELLREFAL